MATRKGGGLCMRKSVTQNYCKQRFNAMSSHNELDSLLDHVEDLFEASR